MTLGAQASRLGLERADLERLIWRNPYAANGIPAFKGRGCWPAAGQQKHSNQNWDYGFAR
jgi:hypothetical protein